MKRKERLDNILMLLDERDQLEVDWLATHYQVSPETIRRDLSELSEKGLLRKIHGGAVKLQTAREHSFKLRTHLHYDQKLAISHKAVQFIKSGDSLLINAGTTTTVFATMLAEIDFPLTVVTNSSLVAYEISRVGNPAHDIYLLGGRFRTDDYETGGTMVIEQIRQFHADHAFLTVGAISAKHGIMEYRVDAVQIARAMLGQARTKTIIVDDSKLDDTALNKICDFDAIDNLVTNATPSKKIQATLNKANVKLHIAEP